MIEVRENLISSSYQSAVFDLVSSRTFEWFFADRTYDTKDKERTDGDTFLFSHLLSSKYNNSNSKYYDFVAPLILSTQDAFNINIKEIIRVKFNMTVKISDSSIVHPPHVDTLSDDCVSVVYYLHDSDGCTVLYDEILNSRDKEKFETGGFSNFNYRIIQSVSPRKGRAVLFNSNRLHSSSTPCMSDRRMVLNCVFRI
jgi:hypothetical protein